MNSNKLYERYQRQMILKNFGEAGQHKLLQAKVLVIGAGGLGCPALQYLAAAGVGTLGIVDDDTVALSNLHRQILFSLKDIGYNKAERAAAVLQQLNNEIKIIAFRERFTTQNALTIMEGFDIIIDGTDNFASRYLINDACLLMNKTLIYGAVSQYEGQVAVFNAHTLQASEPAVNYRDLFPNPPKENEVLNCAEAGVLGVLPGIIGSMQANETIKLITGIGRPLINYLLTYNALNNQLYEIKLTAQKETALSMPKNKDEFLATEYDWLCAAEKNDYEINYAFFDELLAAGNVDVIDVREADEVPAVNEFFCQRIPLNKIEENIFMIKSNTVVTVCQSGNRSLLAAKTLAGIFGTSKKIYSLQGGINGWMQQQTKELL